MRVTVDETRNSGQAAAVELFDVAGERGEISHRADLHDPPRLAEDVRGLEDVDRAQVRAPKRRLPPRGRRHLGEIADQQPPRAVARGRHSPPPGIDGRSIPWSRAVSSASS